MGILFIGIGLLVGIFTWVGGSETSGDWASYQERRHFEQEQKKREWQKWANETLD